MPNTSDDHGRWVEALIHLVQGFRLLWSTPALVRARAYFAPLHVALLGLGCHLYPVEHGTAVVTGYSTVFLLIKAARSIPPSPDPSPDDPDPTPT